MKKIFLGGARRDAASGTVFHGNVKNLSSKCAEAALRLSA